MAHLFASLNDEQLATVQEMSHTVFLEEGESLFDCGDEADRFFLVLSGQMKLYRLSPAGNEKVIDIIRAGSTFAEALMFLEHPTYPVYATALVDTHLLEFDSGKFLQLLRQSVETCFRVMGDMSQRLRRLIKEIDDLTLQSATSRVAAMLIRHMGSPEDQEFTLHAQKGVLASRLSVKPETFSRILHNLSAQGIISVKGSHITVHDLEQLKEAAHTDTVFGTDPTSITPSYPCRRSPPKPD
ncbi:MAG TPA: Crp/Fnr family transcriptional regulator [Chromatiales bacterium]|nr:Crp/Fnr family transcriptional regulator [Chromatiales bacterium]